MWEEGGKITDGREGVVADFSNRDAKDFLAEGEGVVEGDVVLSHAIIYAPRGTMGPHRDREPLPSLGDEGRRPKKRAIWYFASISGKKLLFLEIRFFK